MKQPLRAIFVGMYIFLTAMLRSAARGGPPWARLRAFGRLRITASAFRHIRIRASPESHFLSVLETATGGIGLLGWPRHDQGRMLIRHPNLVKIFWDMVGKKSTSSLRWQHNTHKPLLRFRCGGRDTPASPGGYQGECYSCTFLWHAFLVDAEKWRLPIVPNYTEDGEKRKTCFVLRFWAP